jgi:hypothetical protein
MKTSKIAFATASALLLTTAFSSAQTTIGGNMRVGYKASSSDLGAGIGSNRGFTKETQINVANKGKLNIGGLDYAAGFSIELDGSDLNTTGATTASFGATHYENTFIDIINPATKTTLSFGSDHVKPSDVQLSDIIGGPVRVDQVVSSLGLTAAGGEIKSKYTDKMNAKGGTEGFAIGLIQEVGNIGAFRVTYQPDTSGSGSAVADTGGDQNSLLTATTNANLDYAFRGSLGVQGLDIHLSRTVQDGTGSARDVKFHAEGIKYTMGAITGAYHQVQGDYGTGATDSAKSKEYGLAYAVNKDLSVGLVMINTKDDTASSVEEKIKGINIGYSLGPILLQTVAGKIENAGNTTAQDGKAIHITLGATF